MQAFQFEKTNENQDMKQSIKQDKVAPQGLSYIDNFITKQQQHQLIQNILKQEWNLSLKRRTQHYGWQYKYDRKSEIIKTTPIPEWILPIKYKIQNYIKQSITIAKPTETQSVIIFDQMIINEYKPGQGISPHIDHPELFSNIIVSLSLSSSAVMNFQSSDRLYSQHLKTRSILILEGDARYLYKHSIPARKKDQAKLRTTRYGLTFRTVK